MTDEEMSKEQLEHWLTSDDENAVAWRGDKENIYQWNEMVNNYLDKPGAKHTSRELAAMMMASREQQQPDSGETRRKEVIKRIAREDWLMNGGDEDEFEENWDEYFVDLVTSGRAKRMLAVVREEAWSAF